MKPLLLIAPFEVSTGSRDEIVPKLLNVVMVPLFTTAIPTVGEIEPLPVTVKLHSQDGFICSAVKAVLITVSPLQPAQAVT